MDSLSPLPRRQGGGSGSARSLLLTILGEFVLPADEPRIVSRNERVLPDPPPWRRGRGDRLSTAQFYK